MSGLKPVFVTRHYWPIVSGDQQQAISQLARSFLSPDVKPIVVTARWDAKWSDLVDDDGIELVRLPCFPDSTWGEWRFLRALIQWFRHHLEQTDIVYVAGLRTDASEVIRALQPAGVPVVLRADQCGPSGDLHWQRTAPSGARVRQLCQRADAIVATDSAIRAELISEGYAKEKIVTTADGAAIVDGDLARRRDARQTLSRVSPDLSISENAPLAVYAGHITRHQGLVELVAAWASVVERWPNARLWLIGDGSERATILRQLRHLRLGHRVTLVGMFDNLDDVWAAADAFVLPTFAPFVPLSLRKAMAHGLPIAAGRSVGEAAELEHDKSALLFDPKDIDEVQRTLFQLFDAPERAAQLGREAQSIARKRFSLADSMDAYRELFERLVQG